MLDSPNLWTPPQIWRFKQHRLGFTQEKWWFKNNDMIFFTMEDGDLANDEWDSTSNKWGFEHQKRGIFNDSTDSTNKKQTNFNEQKMKF